MYEHFRAERFSAEVIVQKCEKGHDAHAAGPACTQAFTYSRIYDSVLSFRESHSRRLLQTTLAKQEKLSPVA